MWRETKRDERDEENREESALESVDEESEEEVHENDEEGVKLASRLKTVDTKAAEDKMSGVRIARLDCSATFENLSRQERLYAHHTARAYFEGALMIFLQISHETAGIFILLYRIFSFDTIATLKEKAIALEITEPEWREFLLWSASRLTVRGVHIIPRISYVRLWKLIASSTAASKFPNLISMYESVEKTIFSPLPKPIQPGFPEDGVKTNAVTKRDYDICNAILKKKSLMRSNCRFYKEDIDGVKILKIKVASTKTEFVEEKVGEVKVRIEKGLYAKILSAVCVHLTEAIEHANTIYQKGMLWKYAEHFQEGDSENWIAANILWKLDKNPNVRSKIFFEEGSRGPPGQRSRFEGFVGAVNKEASDKCSVLVKYSKQILVKLPWGKDYEKDKYFTPDFRVLDIIAFGFDGIIKGHNFTNDVTMGRAHVFSNVISVIDVSTKFIRAKDQELLLENDRKAQEIFTGLHELYGHGSGKCFKRKDDGTFNFDKDNTEDILTGGKITSWYEPGQSFYPVFGELGVAFEECRAYAVAYVLCCDSEILQTLGFDGEAGQTLKYAIWLRQLREGLRSLIRYNAASKKWEEGHCWARLVLLKVVLEAGEGCLTIIKMKSNLFIDLDRGKIDSVALPAVREFLKKLQAYKSTADVTGATELFNKYSVGECELEWRRICMLKEGTKPILLMMQPNTVLTEDGGVDLVTYEETSEGVIQSVIDRYTLESVAILEELWKEEKK